MKRAIIVHCWGGNPDYAWYPWAKTQLEARGYSVQVPAMPDTEAPQLETWLPLLTQTIGEPDTELVLIGHSLGCATIMRYLESISGHHQVGQVIFVAGFTDQLGFAELENFFPQPLNFSAIKSANAGGFTVIQSDNDPFVSAQYGDRLERELAARLIIKPGAFHMSGEADGEDACTELPEVVAAVLE